MNNSVSGRIFLFRRFKIFLLLLAAFSINIKAQDRDALAKDPKLFLETAEKMMGWNEPAEPTKIVGNIYFVGTKGLTAWLITGSEGYILVNSAMPPSGKLIEASIHKLGFRPENIKLLITCHAHIDHVGGHACKSCNNDRRSRRD
jgi:metallo-beta-lactamase class B